MKIPINGFIRTVRENKICLKSFFFLLYKSRNVNPMNKLASVEYEIDSKSKKGRNPATVNFS